VVGLVVRLLNKSLITERMGFLVGLTVGFLVGFLVVGLAVVGFAVVGLAVVGLVVALWSAMKKNGLLVGIKVGL
jgi:hypothetical protein